MIGTHRLRRAAGAPPPGWDLAPSWGEPLYEPGPLRAAGPIGRWLYPTLTVTGFLLVTGFVLAHDDPSPGLSARGLLAIALAATVVVLLTLRRAAGPRSPGPRPGRIHGGVRAGGAGRHHRRHPRPTPTPTSRGGKQATAARDQRPPAGQDHRHLARPAGRRRPPAASRCGATPTARPAQPNPPASPRPPARPSPPSPCGRRRPGGRYDPALLGPQPARPRPSSSVAVLTFAVAAVSFATSYGALYAYARDTGLYSSASPGCGRCCWMGRSSSPSWPPSWPGSCAATAPSPS